jgi:hypothetical protein
LAYYKEFQTHILIGRNLFEFGMNIERVNIVFNYDMPKDTDTYLDRVYSKENLFLFIKIFNFRLLVLVDLVHKI